MQRAQRTSLGAGLFGFVPADGLQAPEDQVPEAWLILFTTKHVTAPAVLQGIFSSSRGGRDWALQHAPSVRLVLLYDSVRAKTLRHVSSALSVRCPLPVHLTVLGAGVGDTVARLGGFLTALASGACIKGFTLSCGQDRADSGRVSTVLQDLAEACPQLASLRLDACIGNLPAHLSPPQATTAPAAPQPTPALPHLSNLTVTFPPTTDHAAAVEYCSRSIGAYTAQLTSLNITSQHNIPWPLVFPAGVTSHTLTHLTTDRALTDELLSLLLDHAPGLTRLRVGRLQLSQDTHRTKQWAVEKLTTQLGALDTLALLPSNKGDKQLVVSNIGGEATAQVVSGEVSGVSHTCTCTHTRTHTHTHTHANTGKADFCVPHAPSTPRTPSSLTWHSEHMASSYVCTAYPCMQMTHPHPHTHAHTHTHTHNKV